MSFIVKVHESPNGKVVAVCDKDIFCKKFENKQMVLDLDSDFYKGKEKTEQELIEILKDVYMANFSGNKCVELAIEQDLVDPEQVIEVQGIKHAEALIIRE